MSQLSLKDIPFTEDPTQKELKSYATFFKSSYTSKFCDHFGEDEYVFKVQEKDSKDEAVQKANKVRVRKEDAEEGEGLIERKDLYTFRENFLRKDGAQNVRGYWEVKAGDTDTTTIPPSPVFQFGTLGLEIHSAKQGTIKSVQRPAPCSQFLVLANFSRHAQD